MDHLRSIDVVFTMTEIYRQTDRIRHPPARCLLMLLHPDAFVPERACPCCSAPSRFIGSIDFTESCNDAFEGRRMFRDSGDHISYWRCRACCLLWTDAFDDWSIAEYRER